VIKSYGLKLGDFRFGFQDVIVYTDLSFGGGGGREPLFDPEYFLDPAPAFMLQYALTDTVSGGHNDNSLMGFFGTWKSGDYSADAQVLVDDFDVNMILKPSDYQNPNKIAWTIGGSWDTEFGTFRFDHAGATKYTFEASGSGGEYNLANGYTFYPDTEYELDGALKALDPEANNIGYIHGENNLAFMGSWTKAFGPLSMAADIEFTVTGSQSPANPWGSAITFPNGTYLLDDPVLEKKFVIAGSASYGWGDFRFYGAGVLGYVWNRLELATVSGEMENSLENGIAYYAPSGTDALICSITVGGTWSLKY
jgi:hypothetical protein